MTSKRKRQKKKKNEVAINYNYKYILVLTRKQKLLQKKKNYKKYIEQKKIDILVRMHKYIPHTCLIYIYIYYILINVSNKMHALKVIAKSN